MPKLHLKEYLRRGSLGRCTHCGAPLWPGINTRKAPHFTESRDAWWEAKNACRAPGTNFTKLEVEIVTELARGDMEFLPYAIEAYERVLAAYGVDHTDIYFEFVSEFVTPAPDYGYRASLRERILKQELV